MKRSSRRQLRLRDVAVRGADAVGHLALPEVGEAEVAGGCRKRALTRCSQKFRKTMLGNSVSTKPHSYLRKLWASLRRQQPLEMRVNSPSGVHMELIDKHNKTLKQLLNKPQLHLLLRKIRVVRDKDQQKI